MRPTAAIGHLDADCFYVSAERVRHHFLCGKPVGILGNQGACVIAKSYEMKHVGIKTGMPIWYELNGDPVLPLHTERPPHKILSRGGSLGGPNSQPDRVYAWLVRPVWPEVPSQRCWVHKTANVLDKLPKSVPQRENAKIV